MNTNPFHLATDLSTPSIILDELSQDDNSLIREAVAKHPNTSSSVLNILASDECPAVRIAVALNPKTPADILDIFSQDDILIVLWFVVNHNNTSKETLDKMLRCGRADIVNRARGRLNNNSHN
jgi:hypothetical protein